MAATAPRQLQVVNPATLEAVGSVQTTDPGAVQEVVAEARLAQTRFGETSAAERAALLARVARVTLDRFDEIAATITVNPFDVDGQAAAIDEAIRLPREERRRRLEAIRAYVRAHDLEAWSEAVLADLDRVSARLRR